MIEDYLRESFSFNEDILLEWGGDIHAEPLNFDTGDNGEYRFDVRYKHDGVPSKVTMAVEVDTSCHDKTIDVIFYEEDADISDIFKTTDRGVTLQEKQKLIDAKLVGVMYCIKYQIQHLSCECDTIVFTPASSEKDKKLAQTQKYTRMINRRGNIYVKYAEKYIPELGLEIIDIKKDEGNIHIKTTPFGGDSGTIKDGANTSREISEFLQEAQHQFKSIPIAFMMNLEDDIKDAVASGEIESISELTAIDFNKLSMIFDYLKKKEIYWERLMNHFDDSIHMIKSFSDSSIKEIMTTIDKLNEKDPIEMIRDKVNRNRS